MTSGSLLTTATARPKSALHSKSKSTAILVELPKSKFLLPPVWNGLLIVGDCPHSEGAVAAPFMHSHLGALKTLLKKGGFDDVSGEPALLNLVGVYPKNGYLNQLPESVFNNEKNEAIEVIKKLKPRVVLILGRQTARFLKLGCGDLDDERGAPFMFSDGIVGLLSYHPKEVFRQYELNIVSIADFTKAHKLLVEGWKDDSAEWNILHTPTFKEACEFLHKFYEQRSVLGCDIETNFVSQRMTCIAFAYDTRSAVCIPFAIPTGRYWSEHEEKIIWKLLARVLENCPLVGHNAVHFDHWVLATKHKILAHFVSDTMFATWEVYCEMPKSLAFCNSLYLLNPYWKGVLKDARSGKIDYREEFKYCAKDTIVTLQSGVALKQELAEMQPGSLAHYRFNIRVSRAFQYMSVRGVDFDKPLRDKRVKDLTEQSVQMQEQLNIVVGRPINVNSSKQMKTWLYDELKLPVKYKEKKDEYGDIEMRETQDYLTMLYLARQFPSKPELMLAAKLRKLRKRISSLSAIETRPDGRVSWTFNVVGTETGRASGYKPLDGFGVQPQNVDRRDRDLFLAGEGYDWVKADLEGADSWTVAAQLVSLGDNRMMEDLLGGIKPAVALTMAFLFGRHLISASIEELLTYTAKFKSVKKQEEATRGPGRTTYDAMKAVSHGSNYCMGPTTTHQNIFKKTDGDLFVPIEQCKAAQALYEQRYKGLNKLHERMVSLLSSHGFLDSFSGNRRYFFGRRDNATVREMVAQLPQSHTTLATNQLFERALHWLGNRLNNQSLRLLLEPLNQVHDEACLASPTVERDRAREAFLKMSTNKMSCWGVEFSIPFEANYGPNWGACEEEFI